MKRTLLLLLLPLLLTSCSNPDTSGGVTLSRGGDDGNEFPHGSCDGPGKNPPDGGSGCGWITVNEKSYYIRRWAYLYRATLIGVNLSGAKLRHANLRWANLKGANLSYAILRDADLTDAYLVDANLSNADLYGADLSGVDLYRADLSGANLSGAKGNQYTICPNGHIRSNSGNNCGF